MTPALAKSKMNTLEVTLSMKKAKGLLDALVERLAQVEVETFGYKLAEALVYSLRERIEEK